MKSVNRIYDCREYARIVIASNKSISNFFNVRGIRLGMYLPAWDMGWLFSKIICEGESTLSHFVKDDEKGEKHV